MSGPYKPTTVLVHAVEETDDSPAVPEHTTVETPTNISYTTTRHKGKEIAKPITPLSETASKEDSDPEQAQRDKDMQKILALISKYFKKIYKPTNNNLRTSLNSKNKNTKHSKDLFRAPTAQDLEILIQTCLMPIAIKTQSDSLKFVHEVKQEMHADLKYVKSIEKEIDELESDKAEFSNIYDEILQECVSKDVMCSYLMSLSDLYMLAKLQFWNEKASNVVRKEREQYIKIQDLKAQMQDKNIAIRVNHKPNVSRPQLKRNQSRDKVLPNNSQSDSLKFVHELKQEMHADLKYVESLKKEIDELESDKAEFSDMYDVILQECVSKDVMCSYLMSLSDLDALDELQCFYIHKVKECDCLVQKISKQTDSVSKKVHTELLQRFAKLEKHSISLELALQKCKEQVKNDTVCNEKASNVFRKEREQYFKIQDLKAKLQDKNIAISELKKLIEKGKAKSVDTKFDRLSVVRQSNAQRIPKPSVLGKPKPFLNSLDRIYFQKRKLVPKANVSEGLSKPVTAQTLP
nr:hypothetical protein [Tanacetum cinerariifolium]